MLSKHFPVLDNPGRTITSFADENRKRVTTTKSRLTLLLSFLMFLAACTTTNGQELRDAFRKVKQSVVIVRTKQVDLAPAAGQVISIIDGLGSGVLISADRKILTAAHVVQTADVAWVEFPDGQEIRAQVIPFWSGIDGLLITDDLAKALNLPQPAGVLVGRIADNSIGSRLGLHPGRLRATVQGTDMLLGGDVILSLNDIQITEDNYDQLNSAVGSLKPGDSLLMEVLREGKFIKLSVPVER